MKGDIDDLFGGDRDFLLFAFRHGVGSNDLLNQRRAVECMFDKGDGRWKTDLNAVGRSMLTAIVRLMDWRVL